MLLKLQQGLLWRAPASDRCNLCPARALSPFPRNHSPGHKSPPTSPSVLMMMQCGDAQPAWWLLFTKRGQAEDPGRPSSGEKTPTLLQLVAVWHFSRPGWLLCKKSKQPTARSPVRGDARKAHGPRQFLSPHFLREACSTS